MPGFVHELSKRLTSRFEVHVLAPHAADTRATEVMDGVQVHRFRYAPSRYETLAYGVGMLASVKRHPLRLGLIPVFIGMQLLAARRLLARQNFDVIHAHWLIPQGVVAALALAGNRGGPALVCTSHGADLFALRGRLLEKLKRWVVHRCRAVSVVSQAMADEIRRIAPDCRTVVAPMGVDFDALFTPGLPGDRQAGEILFVGRLVEKKGLRHLIEALPVIIDGAPWARLTVVGSGSEETALRTLVQQKGLSRHVDFLGALPQSELPNHYRRANVFVAPFVVASDGDREGLGLVTVEAIACGCPAVVGDMPVLNDIFDPAEADLRVDPRCTDLLAERILRVLAEPQQAYQRALTIRQRLALRYSWEAVAHRYVTLLQAQVSAGAPPASP